MADRTWTGAADPDASINNGNNYDPTGAILATDKLIFPKASMEAVPPTPPAAAAHLTVAGVEVIDGGTGFLITGANGYELRITGAFTITDGATANTATNSYLCGDSAGDTIRMMGTGAATVIAQPPNKATASNRYVLVGTDTTGTSPVTVRARAHTNAGQLLGRVSVCTGTTIGKGPYNIGVLGNDTYPDDAITLGLQLPTAGQVWNLNKPLRDLVTTNPTNVAKTINTYAPVGFSPSGTAKFVTGAVFNCYAPTHFQKTDSTAGYDSVVINARNPVSLYNFAASGLIVNQFGYPVTKVDVTGTATFNGGTPNAPNFNPFVVG